MGSLGTAPEGTLAAAVRDERLAAVFPTVLVATPDGELLDLHGPDAALAQLGARLGSWLRELLASAQVAGSTPVPVHAQDPSAEGVAWRTTAEGRDVIVLHLRDPGASPAMSDLVAQVRRYEAVLGTGPVFVQILDEHMNVRWSTATLRPELGHTTPQRPSNEEALSFVHPEDLPAIEEDRRRMLRGEPRLQRRIRVRAADGAWRWIELIRANLLDDPELGFFVGYSWDVTEQVERELEVADGRRRLEALIDELDEAVLVVAGDAVQLSNPRFADLFPSLGDAGDLPGRPIADVEREMARTTANPDGLLAVLRRDLAAGRHVRDRALTLKDGRTLELNVLVVDVEGRNSRMWVVRDITAQRRAEQQRERSLEMERGSRRRAEEQIRRLRELDQLKDELVATVSHELRTPLSAVSSYLELLIEDEAALPEEQQALVTAAARGVRRLTRLVDDLLVLARLEARSLPVEQVEVDVADAILQAVDHVRRGNPTAAEVTIRSDVQPGPAWTGDRLRLEQIVTNLLVNAVRFADSSVECRAAADEASWVVEVADDGAGVAEADAERIFERFARGSGGREAPAGAGLGLPISVRLAERLGGSLELVRDRGPDARGALFRVRFPLGGETA